MIQLPPIPGWYELHPLVVHFPIALLLIAPLFVLLGLPSWSPKSRAFLLPAWILMALGTASVFMALQTGKAAGKLAGEAPQVKQVLEQHEELAQTTGVLFLVLTAVFTALLLVPHVLRRELSRTLTTALLLAFLVLYGTGALFLVNTAHQGGRLVHELGVRTSVASSGQTAALEDASEH